MYNSLMVVGALLITFLKKYIRFQNQILEILMFRENDKIIMQKKLQ